MIDELIQDWKASQKKEVLDEIFSILKPFSISCCNKMAIPKSDMEDGMQEARIAIWEALKVYEPNFGNKFTTLLHHYLMNRLRNIKRKIPKYCELKDYEHAYGPPRLGAENDLNYYLENISKPESAALLSFLRTGDTARNLRTVFYNGVRNSRRAANKDKIKII